MSSAAISSDTADREVVVSRVFSAPRDLVFTAFTQPQHVPHWWGPRGFTITTQEMDVRPGGIWRFVMHGPDGTNYDNKIVYRDVVKPSRLVYAHMAASEEERGSFVTTITLDDEGGKTKVTLRAVFRSPEERDEVVKRANAIEGGRQTLARLGEFLDSLAVADREIVSRRNFAAPPERVFGAFSDPRQLALWWGPQGFTNTIKEFDFRPGGKWDLVMHAPDGVDIPNESEIVEINPYERIVYHHLRPMHWFRMSMTYIALPGGMTEVTWRMLFETVEETTKLRSLISIANEQNFDRLAAHLAQTH